MAFGINGKPFINLDNHVDLLSFDKIHPSVARGIAKADPFSIKGTQEIKPNSINPFAQGYEIKTLYEAHSEVEKLTETDPIVLNAIGLDYNEYTHYLKYCIGGYDLHTIFKLIDEETGEWNNVSQYFDDLIQWIDSLYHNVFSSITDVSIITLESGGIPWEHKDPNDNKCIPEFIHIRQSLDRPFYILGEDGKKTFINCRASWFNETGWHGGYPINKPTYNIRIDGKFCKEFKSKIIQND